MAAPMPLEAPVIKMRLPLRFMGTLAYVTSAQTQPQARGTISWQHLNFMGGARQFSADAKYSSIDRGAHVSVHLPYLKKPGLSMTIGTGWWSTNELTYNSKDYGGRMTLAYHSIATRSRDSSPCTTRSAPPT
jgi:outer membrane protein assembly factor BamA